MFYALLTVTFVVLVAVFTVALLRFRNRLVGK